jgi:hypothetical protein
MASVPYISWIGHGTANVAPPGKFTGATTHLFAFATDVHATQSLVETLLNAALSGSIRYECSLGVSYVTFMDIESITSTAETIGWVPGRECAIWVPLWERHLDDPNKDRPVLWAPYVFISYGIGMVIGREIWGWPKVIGQIEMPTRNGDPALYKCSTMLFSTFSTQTQGQIGMLLSVGAEFDIDLTVPQWTDPIEAAQNIIALTNGPEVASRFNPLGDLRMSAIALKQFRDSAVPAVACFQGVVDSPIQVTRFWGGGVHLGPFDLTITTCASHGIVKDLLGRNPAQQQTTLPILFAAWLKFDFDALPGGLIR